MVKTFDCGYLATPIGQLNIAEIVCLIGALISVAFTSRLYSELADNLQYVYPELNTTLIRSIFQAFTIFCLAVTIAILIIHLYGVRFSGRSYQSVNRLCLIFNIIMGLMMISVGICAAFWEDKLRSTPGVIRRGYYVDRYQYVFGELTHPRPGAAAAAAVFALLAGILFLIEACTRPMLETNVRRLPTYYTEVIPTIKHVPRERIIPIETVRSSYQPVRV